MPVFLHDPVQICEAICAFRIYLPSHWFPPPHPEETATGSFVLPLIQERSGRGDKKKTKKTKTCEPESDGPRLKSLVFEGNYAGRMLLQTKKKDAKIHSPLKFRMMLTCGKIRHRIFKRMLIE